MPSRERQSDRVLSEDEIRTVWRALDDEDLVMAATFKMRLLTAQRGIEVLKLRWRDIDGDWWTIPADVVKNDRAHGVPISRPARAILAELRPETGFSGWVFESPRKPGASVSSAVLHEVLQPVAPSFGPKRPILASWPGAHDTVSC